ncbi:anti-sigma F factor antagonist [Clostridia bacterium]|nr:anti-sigma F factor antagonist [Clostridia bacterium]
MKHRFEQEKGNLIIFMPKELDHHSAQDLRTETDFLLARYPVRGMVFDFQETTFMDSSGIGMILGRCKQMGFCGGRVCAIHLNPQVQKIFRMSGLYKVVEVEL